MDELVRWLGEQLDADERIARGATDGPWTRWRGGRLRGLGDLIHPVLTPGQKPGAKAEIVTASWMDADHIAAHDPARVLREINAKRQTLGFLVEEMDRTDNPWWYDDKMERILKLLALPYADRPGYKAEEWAP